MMKTYLLGTLAALGLTLGLAASPASAAWVTRTAYRWDPYHGRHVSYTERVWVPDRCDDRYDRPWWYDGRYPGRYDDRYYERSRDRYSDRYDDRYWYRR